jgi:hypothetical protein
MYVTRVKGRSYCLNSVFVPCKESLLLLRFSSSQIFNTCGHIQSFLTTCGQHRHKLEGFIETPEQFIESACKLCLLLRTYSILTSSVWI